jgi:hypothetical protein
LKFACGKENLEAPGFDSVVLSGVFDWSGFVVALGGG